MRDIFEKIDDLLTVEGLKNNWTFLAVPAIFLLAVWLRFLPENGMTYLQALDPYMIFRMSRHLALDGNLPALDFMRYFPFAQPSYTLQLGNILFPALLYWLGPFLFFSSFLEWAQFYPALMGGIGVLFAYLFGKEVWNKTAGVSSAFFLATLAGVMHRTSAGFFEKEPIGTAFMMISFYFFVRAWRRDSWLPGIGAGLGLAGFTLSWGGAKMAWLLFPLTVGLVMLLDEDIEQLMKSYTPTVIIGGGVAAALNPSKFWLTSSLFLANFGLLGLLWSRKLVEELELLEDHQLKYYTPGMYAAGILALLLSPLYSNFIASRFMALISRASQGAGGVIAGTVAENQPATLSQLVSQLSALSAINLHPALGFLSNILGAWPLAFLSVAIIGSPVILMVARKYGFIGREIERKNFYYTFAAALLAWSLVFAAFFQDSVLFAIAPSILLATGWAVFILLQYLGEGFEEFEVEFNWYYVFPLMWIVTNILGAVAKSRLIFLGAFPVAISAGYTVSVALRRIERMDLPDVSENFEGRSLGLSIIGAIVLAVLVVNTASGYSSAKTLSGSPNQLWMDNLEYMEENTEKGSVILSWWDYGYWFESIGRRPAVADGGNSGFYSSQKNGKVNYPIADFLTSSNPENHTDLLEKHSVDFLVLDETMIGKYSAVSQISNRDNSEFNSMLQVGTQNFRDSLSGDGNSSILTLTGRGIQVYVPVSQEGEVDIDGVPALEAQGQRIDIDCVLTENGRKDFETDSPSRYCLAENPFYSFENAASRPGFPGRAVLVPKEIADSTLVRLYLMDGHGIDFAEKVPGGSNGFVKMWKIDTS